VPIAVAGVARPESVWAALDRLGIACKTRLAFGDHQRYTSDHVRAFTEAAGRAGIVTTLKDAVKLHALLPHDVPLYALTQEVRWEAGRENWDRACERLRARATRRLEPA
jgi:tetraacyldisaccharide-1-P 4'-kinase